MKRNPEKQNYTNYSDSLDQHHWKLTATKNGMNNDDQHIRVHQMKGLVKQWKIPTERNSCGGTETHSTTNAASICMIVNRDDIEVPTDLQFEFNAPGPVEKEEEVIETPPNRRRFTSLPRTMNHPSGNLHTPTPSSQGIYKNFKLTAVGFTEKVSQSQPNEKHFKLTKHGQMKEKKIIL